MKRKMNRKPPPGNVRWAVSTGHNICGVMTNKADRTVQFESWAERALLLRLDRDPEVNDFGSQPETFEFVDEQGKRRHYTPDFIVWRSNGTEIHEVTCSERRVQPRMIQREAAGASVCARRGWSYIVHTEQDLPQGSELANLLALYRYRPKAYAHPQVTTAIQVRLGSGEPVTLLSVARQMALDLNLPAARVVAALGHLLWHGQLQTDLTRLMFGPMDMGLMPGTFIWQEVQDDKPTR